ncbi:MAG: hypothetical protein ABIR18_03330, partial [Chitinophagaceae bacterium]
MHIPNCLYTAKQKDDLQSYTFSYSIDLLNNNNTIENFKNSFNISFFKNFILYEFHHMYDSTNSGLVLPKTFNEDFFVFEKDSLYGYSYIPHRPSSVERFPVDSILNARAFKTA